MRFTRILWAGLFSSVAGVGLACDIPPLVAIPAKDDVGGKAQEIRDETAKYFDAMRTYTQCVQAELAEAGGEAAAPITKAALVQRNNMAVAEAEAVMKLFTANVGPVESPGPSPQPPPAADDEERRRNRD
jgi:hypothetical protein